MSTGSAVSGYKVYERVVYDLYTSLDHDLTVDGMSHFFGDETQYEVDTVIHHGVDSLSTSLHISNITGGSVHHYVVSALSSSGEGELNQPLSVSTSPSRVGGVVSVSQTTSGIELEWDVPAVSSGSAVSGYIVYMDDGAGGAVD
eukprot:SAG11_NODE_19352_length_468_cov_1.542005_2_plen_143_part_01